MISHKPDTIGNPMHKIYQNHLFYFIFKNMSLTVTFLKPWTQNWAVPCFGRLKIMKWIQSCTIVLNLIEDYIWCFH